MTRREDFVLVPRERLTMADKIARTTVVQGLRDAVTKLEQDRLGSPAITVPLSALHFYQSADGEHACVIDAHAVVNLADNLLREAKG